MLMPHSITDGDACFAYFNKKWGIPRCGLDQALSGNMTRVLIDDERIKSHLDRVVRGSVEETLNALLEAEADQLCNAQRYERSEARRDTRAGHYERVVSRVFRLSRRR